MACTPVPPRDHGAISADPGTLQTSGRLNGKTVSSQSIFRTGVFTVRRGRHRSANRSQFRTTNLTRKLLSGQYSSQSDGRYVASSCDSFYEDQGSITLLDAHNGQIIETFTGNPEAVAFSPDSQMLVSIGKSAGVTIWDIASGASRGTCATPQQYQASFSADGRFVLSTGTDDALHVWDARDCSPVLTSLSYPDGSWISVTSDGFFASSGRGTHGLAMVRGLDSYSIDQAYQALYRPDLVAAALAGDPDGKVAAAAAKLDLNTVVDLRPCTTGGDNLTDGWERYRCREHRGDGDGEDQGGIGKLGVAGQRHHTGGRCSRFRAIAVSGKWRHEPDRASAGGASHAAPPVTVTKTLSLIPATMIPELLTTPRA